MFFVSFGSNLFHPAPFAPHRSPSKDKDILRFHPGGWEYVEDTSMMLKCVFFFCCADFDTKKIIVVE